MGSASPSYRFAVNPRWDALPGVSAVVRSGLAGDYHVPAYRTTLSLKTVAHGVATYATRRSRYLLDPGSVVVLNEGQEYTLDIDARDRTSTLCLFFEPGFVEGVAQAMNVAEREVLEPGESPLASSMADGSRPSSRTRWRMMSPPTPRSSKASPRKTSLFLRG